MYSGGIYWYSSVVERCYCQMYPLRRRFQDRGFSTRHDPSNPFVNIRLLGCHCVTEHAHLFIRHSR